VNDPVGGTTPVVEELTMRTIWLSALLLGCTGSAPPDDTDTDADTDTDTEDPRPDCTTAIDLSFNGLATPAEGVPWTDQGLSLVVQPRAGTLAVDTATFDCLWLHPGELHVDTSALDCRLRKIATVDASSFCGTGCAELATYDSDGASLGREEGGGGVDSIAVVASAPFETAVFATDDTILCGLRLE
jgi:hypothetical protein